MGYENVKAKCFFCDAIVEGNQRFMLAGRTLFGRRGSAPKWLKEKPEHRWDWNGLSGYIDGVKKSYDFYLCPLHQSREHYQRAFDWAQKQIDGDKALAELLI